MTRSRRKNDFLNFSKNLLALFFCTSLLIGTAQCSRKSESATPKPTADSSESVIEEVNSKQLERILQDKDYVAVFWCKLIIQHNGFGYFYSQILLFHHILRNSVQKRK